MTNHSRLRNNAARHKRERSGVPRKGQAPLQGIAICGRCARQMGLHYSGPKGTYPVYKCEGDYSINGTPRCQKVRALSVDAEIEKTVLESLSKDQIVVAVEAVSELGSQARLLDKQWKLKW